MGATKKEKEEWARAGAMFFHKEAEGFVREGLETQMGSAIASESSKREPSLSRSRRRLFVGWRLMKDRKKKEVRKKAEHEMKGVKHKLDPLAQRKELIVLISWKTDRNLSIKNLE